MKQFDYSIIKNPEIFQQNRLPAHAELASFYGGIGKADSTDDGTGELESIRFLSLDGRWKFSYAENYQQAVPDLRPWNMIAMTGQRSRFRDIFNCRDTIFHTIPILLTPGMARRMWHWEMCRSVLTRWQNM